MKLYLRVRDGRNGKGGTGYGYGTDGTENGFILDLWCVDGTENVIKIKNRYGNGTGCGFFEILRTGTDPYPYPYSGVWYGAVWLSFWCSTRPSADGGHLIVPITS